MATRDSTAPLVSNPGFIFSNRLDLKEAFEMDSKEVNIHTDMNKDFG